MNLRAVAVVAVLAASCGGSDDSPSERPGNAAVYERIEAMTDCAELQAEFDTAMENVERHPAGASEREAPLAYATATEDRRSELGC